MSQNSETQQVTGNDAHDQIKAGTLISYVGIAFDILSGLIYTPWMLKQIGQSDYGLYTLVMSLVGYFLIDFGLGNAISRYVSNYRSQKNEQAINGLLGLVYKIYLGISAVACCVLIVLFFYLGQIFTGLTSAEVGKLQVIYVIGGLFSVTSFAFTPLNGILISFEQFVPYKLSSIAQKVLTVVLMVVALLYGFGLYAMVLINAVTGLLMILYKLLVVWKKTPIKIQWNYWNKTLLKDIVFYSFWITVIGVVQKLTVNIMPAIIARYATAAAVAVYSVGKTLQSYVNTFSDALNGMFMPQVARLNTADDKKGIDELMIKVGRIQLLIIGIIIIGFYTMGQEFIQLWVGSAYRDAYLIAGLLIAPQIVMLTQEIANTKLYVIGEVKYRSLLFLSTSVVGVVLSILLLPRYGAVGATVGISFTYIACNVIGMNIVYARLLKIDIWRFFKSCHLAMLPTFLGCGGIAWAMQKWFPVEHLTLFCGKAVMIAVVYAVAMWVFVMNDYERGLVKSLFKWKLH